MQPSTTRRPLSAIVLVLLAAGCGSSDGPAAHLPPDVPSAAALVAAAEAGGLVRVTYPDPDPGIPGYARLNATLNQYLHTDDWIAIPFYRDPDAVPGGFNLLAGFDFPGAHGPGAFAAPLLISGYYLIERGAPLGTFPRISIARGKAVPVWFVPWPDFKAAMADNVVTMDDLRSMNPLMGVATHFEETLRPRIGEHLVVINAKGTLDDGRRFDLHVTHVEDTTRAIRVSIR